MNIGIIGAGKVGGALGKLWAIGPLEGKTVKDVTNPLE
jgi:hypothetical protein